MFAIKLSMEKGIKRNWAAGFSDLPAINATVFSSFVIPDQRPFCNIWLSFLCLCDVNCHPQCSLKQILSFLLKHLKQANIDFIRAFWIRNTHLKVYFGIGRNFAKTLSSFKGTWLRLFVHFSKPKTCDAVIV